MSSGFRRCVLGGAVLAGLLPLLASCGERPDATASGSEPAQPVDSFSPAVPTEASPDQSVGKVAPPATDVSIPADGDFHPIPLNPEGTFAPNYPVPSEGFEEQADAPFPASIFLASNRIVLNDESVVYAITAGRRGADGLSKPTGALWIETMDAKTGTELSNFILDVESCVGGLELIDDSSRDLARIPLQCKDPKSGVVLARGSLDAALPEPAVTLEA